MPERGSNFDERTRHRRLAWAAGLTLFTLLAGHTVLEVARDALFLAHLPASELPFTYLAIALAAWVAVQVDRRLSTRLEQRRLAMLTLGISAAGTLGFYFAFGSDEWWVWFVPHFFYIWAGLVSTFAVTQFWRLLAELFTVGEARLLYSRIAAGGSLGAVAGASIAGVAQEGLAPRELLLIGAAMLAVTACIPGLLFPAVPPVEVRTATAVGQGSADELAYVRRLLVLVALTAVTAILVDYVFKASIDAELSASELAPFFSRFYIVLNVISLGVQIALAPRLLTWLGAPRALAVLPLLFALGAVGHAVTGALAVVIVLKGSDGALRHSLHRSASELLYLPLSKAVRSRYKTLIDALGQRGGQALGSVSILIVGAFGIGPRHLGPVIALLSILWIALALSLHRRYLDRFRANLRAGSIETRVEIPQLDLGSLESLMASLNSPRDEEVLATLEVLVDYGRGALVPALLLYHPSRAVVLRTLEILALTDRNDYVQVARRLLEHTDDEVQTAAMHAIADRLGEHELRQELEHGHGRSVRASTLVALVARGFDEDGEAEAELEKCARGDLPPVRLAVARAIRFSADPSLLPFLRLMAGDADAPLIRELARAFGAIGASETVADLLPWLGPRGARLEARAALAEIGEPAFEQLVTQLADETTPLEIRVHIPRTLARFRHERSAKALFEQLLIERDGWVAYKILRALRPLREAMPLIRFDGRELTRLMRQDLSRAAKVLRWRTVIEAELAENASRRTRGSTLLAPALREKEAQALDRVVRLVALLHPNEDLRRISNALRHGDRRRQAESRELLTALAPTSIAGALDAMLDDAPDAVREARVADALTGPKPVPTYDALLGEMLDDVSESVRTVTAYHVGELRLTGLRDALERAAGLSDGLSHEVVTRALDELDTAGEDTQDG